jgi:hypothetical protein
MGLIENTKTYTGRDLETIFFRPMLTGENAEQLGIRMLYNMPVPTTIQLWSPNADILQEYEAGWSGGSSAQRVHKTIELQRVKAEVGFSASDYFQQVYEHIVSSADVNLDDLTGTALEAAETEMFRAAIAESLRVTMWIGDTSGTSYNKFDGFVKKIINNASVQNVELADEPITKDNILETFNSMWAAASPELKAMKSDGNLVFLVTSNIYDAYEQYLDSCGSDAAYNDLSNGRRELSYHGIKIIDMGVSQFLAAANLPQSICMLTDRRNLVLAVNTADYPGSEVRMWYNPDAMENRQRAIFMVGCDVIDDNLVVKACLRGN